MSDAVGKGDSGGGAGAAIQYGDKAIALQKQIYDQSRSDLQPYLKAGTTGLNELMYRLGLSGGDVSGDQGVASSQKSLDYAKSMLDETNSRNVDPNSATATAAQQKDNAYWQSGVNDQQAAYDKAYNAAQTTAKAGAASDPNFGQLLKSFDNTDFTNDPGYQFRLSEGEKGLDRQLAAGGKYMTPEAAKALDEYNQNFASNEYTNAYNRYNTNNDNIYNRLAGITGTGQTATNTAANVGSNYANQAGEVYQGIGNSITASNQAQAANSGSFFNNLIGSGAKVGAAYYMSDMNLKENISRIGSENGHNIYSFNYKGEPNRKFVGVLAQEVQQKTPEAVAVSKNGYLAVDYDAIGVKFQEVQ